MWPIFNLADAALLAGARPFDEIATERLAGSAQVSSDTASSRITERETAITPDSGATGPAKAAEAQSTVET